MKKAKTTKRALLASVISTLMCCAMLVGSTFAWFTDSVTSGVNSIVAGNLDIELNVKKDGEFVSVKTLENNALFNVDAWEPGVVAYETFEAVNAGDLALKYNMYLSFTNMNKVKDTDYTLADVIKVAVLEGEKTYADDDRETLLKDVEGKLQLIGNTAMLANGELINKGNTQAYTVVAYWEPTNNDNNYNLNNGKESDNGEALHIDFAVTLSATQLTSESDSFDNKYDENAALDIQAVTDTINQGAKDSNAAIKAAIEEKGGNPELIYFDEEGLQKIGDELAITLNFKAGSSEYVDVTYTAVKALIGKAVNEQAGSIYSIKIATAKERVLNGQPFEYDSADWVEEDLKTTVKKLNATGGLQGALEVAKTNGLPVVITDMNGNATTYRMNFAIDANW